MPGKFNPEPKKDDDGRQKFIIKDSFFKDREGDRGAGMTDDEFTEDKDIVRFPTPEEKVELEKRGKNK